MTQSEWKLFQRTLFIAFPGFLDWINAKSISPVATLDSWFRTLEDVSYENAMKVVEDWQRGDCEPPKLFDRDYVAIHIRSRVGFMASKAREGENKYRVAKSLYEQQKEIAERRKTYVKLPCMVNAYATASKAWTRKIAGEITHADYDEICKKSLDID